MGMGVLSPHRTFLQPFFSGLLCLCVCSRRHLPQDPTRACRCRVRRASVNARRAFSLGS